MRLVDTHSHIHDRAFAGDVDQVIARALAAGVEMIVTLGENVADSRAAVALAERHACVVAAAGVHPHEAKDAGDREFDELREVARHPRVALIGEIGLDFYRNLSPREQQVDVLRKQLEIGADAARPVAVHTRDAQDEMLALLTAWSRHLGGKLSDGRPIGVMHYFSGDVGQAMRYVELGFLISVHTSVTHPKAFALREVARDVPLGSLVLETDSPYGAPQRTRGTRNEPAYVADAALAVAEARGLDVDEVASVTTANALRLLGIRELATS
jgi:TatD DNase family protein